VWSRELRIVADTSTRIGTRTSGPGICGACPSSPNAATQKLCCVTSRVEIRHGSVSQLPFPDAMFDRVTAVETHFWWPNLPGDMREVFRVTKPGGTLILIAEVYKGASTRVSKLAEKYASRTGMTLLSVEEHRELLTNAGYSNVQVIEKRGKGWICGIGRKREPTD
jgi:ubiquinone/menaquinone biosynthesis C-methylase UbiE